MTNMEHIKLDDLTFYDVLDPAITRNIINTNAVDRSFPFGKGLKLLKGENGEEAKIIKAVLDSSLLFQFSMHHQTPLQYWKYGIGFELTYDEELEYINKITVKGNVLKIVVNPQHFYNYFLDKQQDELLVPGYDGCPDDFWKDVNWHSCQVAYTICACFAPVLGFAHFIMSLNMSNMDGTGIDLLSLSPENQALIVNFTDKDRIASKATGYKI